MNNIKEKDIIRVKITGIQEYGAFAIIDGEYDGLIHISEISYGFVRDISDYLRVGEYIYAEVIDIDDDSIATLKLILQKMEIPKNFSMSLTA